MRALAVLWLATAACAADQRCLGLCDDVPPGDAGGGGAGDRPPTFAGIAGVLPDGDGALLLWWQPAADDRTPWQELDMLILRGDEPRSHNPPVLHAVVRGVSFRDTGLRNGQRYTYRVLARDHRGQLDGNQLEVAATAEAPPVLPPGVSYPEIARLFSQRCVHCHGGTSGLSLDSYAAVIAGNWRGPVVVPCRPEQSTLALKLSGQAGFGARMPRDGPPFLSPLEQALVERWIADGAGEVAATGTCP